MEYQEVEYQVSEQIATITMNRPERLNAFTPRMALELSDALLRADDEDEVRVVIVTGAGRAFCAGADLTEGAKIFQDFTQMPEMERRWIERLNQEVEKRAIVPESPVGKAGSWGAGLIHLLWALKKPVIAVMKGPAVGFGAAFPLSMDFRFAGESAKIGFVFPKRGVVPESLSPFLLPRIIGLGKALDLLLTGRIVRAEEALKIGLVHQVYSDSEVMERAREFAKEIYENCAPVAVALTKRMVWQFLLENDPVNLERINHTYFFWTTTTPDCIEGIKSFLEKRKPNWKMSPKKDLPEFFPL